MKTFDNHGNLVHEINNSRTQDGKSISTVTMYNTYNGRVIGQDVTIRDSQGNITSEHIIGGKILP